MKVYNYLTIRGKFISLVIFLLFFELILSLVGIQFLNRLDQRLSHIIDVSTEKIKLAGMVNTNLFQIVRAEKNLLTWRTVEEVREYTDTISLQYGELQESIAKLEGLVDDKGLILLKQFKTAFALYWRENGEIRRMIDQDVEKRQSEMDTPSDVNAMHLHRQASELSRNSARDAFNRAVQTMTAIIDKNDADLDQDKAASDRSVRTALVFMSILSIFSIASGLLLGIKVSSAIASGLGSMVKVADAIAGGDLATEIQADSKDEIGLLAKSVISMQNSLRQARVDSKAREWLQTGLARLNDAMRGELEMETLCSQIISEVSTYLDGQVGAVYLLENGSEPVLSLYSSYAYTKPKGISNRFQIGESLVGQAAREKKQILVRNVPDDYIKVASGLGEACPQFIVVTPLLYEGRVKGVIEVATLGEMTDLHLHYLNEASPAIAISLETAQGRDELGKALAQSRALTDELQAQQEELRTANEELEEQTQLLRGAEEKLKIQQEELETTNEELIEKNESLVRQKQDIERANRDLQNTRRKIEEKAEELTLASKYKSEFLANMSHELRTPLNSLLLLAQLMTENKERNLTTDQIESAEIIYKSGNDLLSLINEILDLAKIEAGKMDLHPQKIFIEDIVDTIGKNFQHIADDKGIDLKVTTESNTPKEITTDFKRLGQIIKNLVSNAIKFTERGAVTVTFASPENDTDLSRSGLKRDNTLAIRIEDTGIGIPPDQQKIVFEAFQQLNGGTTRKFAGTGLGLSISRELAHLLGGEIQVNSQVGQGSAFTLYIPHIFNSDERRTESLPPIRQPATREVRSLSAHPRPQPIINIPDDREGLKANEKAILIIEDDTNFARLLLKQCHERGFKCLSSATGEEGIDLAKKFLPAAVILDLRLPGLDGWKVLEALKDDPDVRHIPVHIMSVEDSTIEAFRKGAIGYLRKPVSKGELEEAFGRMEAIFNRSIKELLVVEDDAGLRRGIIQLVGNGDVHADEAATGEEAAAMLAGKKYDCMILDLGLPDMSGFELLKELESDEQVVIPPVIVYTGKELTQEEEMELNKYAESIIIKGVRSEERLLDEASLFLHRVVDRLPEKKRNIITNLHCTDIMFQNKCVLMVDDDMRNVFALAKVLEEKGMVVLKAENGQKALDILAKGPDVDLILMDIMMPVMDGYETIERIREQTGFQNIPIIALTAKAMKEDRTRCIEAGASDYLTKPVDISRLFAMLRVWLYR